MFHFLHFLPFSSIFGPYLADNSKDRFQFWVRGTQVGGLDYLVHSSPVRSNHLRMFLFYLLDLVVDLIKSHYYLAITTMIDNMLRFYDLVCTYAQQNFLVSKNVVIDLHFVSHKLK